MAKGPGQIFFRNIISLILPVDSKFKGALLVLLWSMMMFIYQKFTITYVTNSCLIANWPNNTYADVAPYILYYSILPMYPVIGLLADICVGRYKIIVASMHCAFMGWITLCVSFYVTYKFRYVCSALVTVGYLLATVGAAGIQSIAVPFNIDQMVGATADQLSGIVYWYSFGYPLAFSLEKISKCLINIAERPKVHHQIVGVCVSGAAITIVMVSYYLLRHHLDTTPLLTNPLKLIVKVLNYARKNKYPRLRSALTYWEESAPSRLDLGKDKYGGPFTEEEVEDVKTFFRFMPLLVCIFGLTGVTIIAPSVNASHNRGTCKIFNCMLQNNSITSMSVVIVLVTNKLLYSKCCWKYIPSMIKRIGLGLCLLLLCTTVLAAMDVNDYTATCTLKTIAYNATKTNYALASVAEIIRGIGAVTVLLAILELAVAQSPGHMRGLMVSILYGVGGIFFLLSYVIYMPHKQIHSHCTLYYHVTVSVCIVLTIAVYGVLAKRYKLRTRNEVINIHHIVATVYERYIDQSEQYRQLHL